MRRPCFVPGAKPVDHLLAELHKQGTHLAVVLDEFGGTYGVVTMEDLIALARLTCPSGVG